MKVLNCVSWKPKYWSMKCLFCPYKVLFMIAQVMLFFFSGGGLVDNMEL